MRRRTWLLTLLLLPLAGCFDGAEDGPGASGKRGPEAAPVPEPIVVTFDDSMGPGRALPLVGVVPGSAQVEHPFDVGDDIRRVSIDADGDVAIFVTDGEGRAWCGVRTGRCDVPAGPNATGTWMLRLVSLAPQQQVVHAEVRLQATAPALGADRLPLAGFAIHEADRNGGEPTLAALADGSVLVVAGNDVLRLSTDGQWVDVTPPIDTQVDVTLDPFLVGDPVTGKVYVSQLAACQRISWTQDAGQTWMSNPLACGGPDQHHQKLAIGPDGLSASPTGRALHMMTMNLATWFATDEVILTHAVSLDDGRTWTQNPAMVPAVHGLEARAIGNVAVDEEAGVHAVAYLCDAFFGVPYEGMAAGVSRDLGTTWTWQPIAPGGGTCEGIDPGIAVDGDAVHVIGWDASAGAPALWHIRSSDLGETWSPPERVPTTGLGSFVLADVAARDGKVAAVFLATPDSARGPNDVEGWVRWFPYIAVLDQVPGKPAYDPQWSIARLEDHPVQIGRICMEGPSCLDNSRNLLDFVDVQIDPQGRVVAAYVDGCLDGCEWAWESRSARLRVAIEPRP